MMPNSKDSSFRYASRHLIIQVIDLSGATVLPHWLDVTLRQRAADRGYANSFEALRASVPWRPLLVDESGARTCVRPRVAGPLIAIIVGALGLQDQ